MENITIEQAQELALAHTKEITETENVSLLQAPGRILAQDMTASFHNPPFDRSPIDGYACKSADLSNASKESPAKLTVVREIDAGQYSTQEIQPGQAVRIMTGAAIPPGCDCCIRQEDTDYGEEQVSIYRRENPWGNYCFAGEDFKEGDPLLHKGSRLSFVESGVLAGMGLTQAPVYRQPRAAVFTTGDEVVLPGSPLPPGKIYNSNLALLTARLQDFGVQLVHMESIPDEPAAMADAIQKAAQDSDIIFTTGAVSVGKKDIMHEALSLAGAQRIFWRVQIKPGMPTLFSIYEGVPILSLSGNPFGVAVVTELLARPMIQKMRQDDSLKPVRVQGAMADAFGKSSKMRRFVRAIWNQGVFSLPDGLHSNGVLASMIGCNCLLDIEATSPEIKAGDQVEAILL
ncbi:MAG: molybdopterin molybdotransferase MoeA [Lachnospiraceae bacterium]|nr:molybdopterin molybdotransferase MoeA [Lachnospiraceae bacterium]